MYAPPSGHNEWVELYNTGSASVDISSCILHDATTARARIAEQPLLLAPGSYIVIAGDAAVRMEFPGPYVLVVMRDFPAWNNGGDDVALLAPDSSVLDFVQYRSSWGGSAGRSLERISLTGPSNSYAQWAGCIDPLRGTPGARNSVALPDYDISLAYIEAAPLDASPSLDIAVKVLVRNTGSYPAEVFEVGIFDDADGDGIPDTSVPGRTLHSSVPLAPGDSCLLEGFFTPGEKFIQALIVVSVFHADQRSSNDTLHAEISQRLSRNVLVVNELMYAPLDGASEWIELINHSERHIGLDGIMVEGRTGSGSVTTVVVHVPGRVLAPGDFIVLASDSSVLSHCGDPHDTLQMRRCVVVTSGALDLGNEGEDVVIRDRTGSVLDSVRYHPGLHNPNVYDTRGRSLERLHPDFPSASTWAWSTSADVCGGTPGRRNSLYTDAPPWIEQPGARCTLSPNPFSPDGDGREDHCLIRYELPSAVAQIRVRVYDAIGRYVRTIQSNSHSGRSGELIFDGRDDRQTLLPVGQYVVLIEAVDFHRADVAVMKAVAVIATPL
ncbi:MAG: lamin tail domain-containing protein [Ignavibacteriae bacterium]|nr:lamin tail domain-containing protein [Ignavibacteriota bacterium]